MLEIADHCCSPLGVVFTIIKAHSDGAGEAVSRLGPPDSLFLEPGPKNIHVAKNPLRPQIFLITQGCLAGVREGLEATPTRL